MLFSPYFDFFQDVVLAVKSGEAKSSERPQSPVGTMYIKVVLLGDPAVGKTSLFFRIFRDEFTDLYKTTIGVDFCLIGTYVTFLHLINTPRDWATPTKTVWSYRMSTNQTEWFSPTLFRNAIQITQHSTFQSTLHGMKCDNSSDAFQFTPIDKKALPKFL